MSDFSLRSRRHRAAPIKRTQTHTDAHKRTQTASSRSLVDILVLSEPRELLFMPWFTLLFISCFSSLPAITRIQTGPTCQQLNIDDRDLSSSPVSDTGSKVGLKTDVFICAFKCIWKHLLNSNRQHCDSEERRLSWSVGVPGGVFRLWLLSLLFGAETSPEPLLRAISRRPA